VRKQLVPVWMFAVDRYSRQAEVAQFNMPFWIKQKVLIENNDCIVSPQKMERKAYVGFNIAVDKPVLVTGFDGKNHLSNA